MYIMLVIISSSNWSWIISGSTKYMNKELYDHLANMTYSCYDKLIEEKIYGNKDSYWD